MLLSILIACPAERLGVELPPGGVDAITMEGLRHDLDLLTNGEPAATLRTRFAAMRADEVRAGDGWVCAHLEGPGGARLLRASWPTADDLSSRVGAAALLSLTMAWEGSQPPRDTWLCAARAGADLPDELDSAEQVPVAPLASGVTNPDWRVVRHEVQRLFQRMDAR